MNETKFISFMAHISHKECDTLCKDLESYKYLFGMEEEDYEHFHFLVEMSDKQYHAFSKKVFKDRYKLHGRWWVDDNGKKHPRQYGKVKKINDMKKIARYTCKDKNVKTNLSAEELDDLLGQKLEECSNYKGDETKDKMCECMEWIEKQFVHHIHEIYKGADYNFVIADKQVETGIQYKQRDTYDAKTIKIYIIKYFKENKINIRRTTIDSYYYYICCNSQYLDKTPESIYNHLYGEE